MGKGRPAVDPRWACPELGQANDLVLGVIAAAEPKVMRGEMCWVFEGVSLSRVLGKIQAKLLAADAAFAELQAKGGE